MPQRIPPAAELPAALLDERVLARPFLPTLDLVEGESAQLKELTEDDKRDLLLTKVADITHFRVGLTALHRHADTARELAADVRPLPREVRGVLLNPDGNAAARVRVQPEGPVNQTLLGRGVVTSDLGVFSLPLARRHRRPASGNPRQGTWTAHHGAPRHRRPCRGRSAGSRRAGAR